jgi:Type I phosphodiesterase / nucleotide pyrophosphatase
MMRRSLARLGSLLLFSLALDAGAKRVVVIKVDGLPQDLVDREIERIDPATGRSSLPWIDRVFAQRGTRLANFYVRAISLSAPSWSLLDSGQHLQIRGNAEFDRYTFQVYDYLNFFPFYLGYALSRRVDMPGVQVLDELKTPLLIDRFSYRSGFQSFQMFQRGVRWKTLQHSLEHHFSKSPRDLLDEWAIGSEIGGSLQNEMERELMQKLADPRIQYLDYFFPEYDHVAHGTPDLSAQRVALGRIDSMIGRVWTAIETSPLAAETVLVLVSDHGMNTQPGVYSQGFDLVAFFNSRAGGGHHVVTDRHPLTEYKLKGLDPFVSNVVTSSEASLYLKGESDQYPTALLDLDGNERAAVYLRNSDLNRLHILLSELNQSGMSPATRREKVAAFSSIVGEHRAEWQSTVNELGEELGALGRAIEDYRARIAAQPKKWTEVQRDDGLDKTARRLTVQMEALREQERSYSEYADALQKLLGISASDFDQRHLTADALIPKRAMGDANSIHDLQNYEVADFQTLNYLPLLTGLSVRNNVQPQVGAHPIDFIAVRIPKGPEQGSADAIFLYGSENRQGIIQSRQDSAGNLELKYLPVSNLRQDRNGVLHFDPAEWASGFPLRLSEDTSLDVPDEKRAEWLNSWHPEKDWMRAVHKTRYSNGIVALHEQFLRTAAPAGLQGDALLLARFNARRRRLAEPDFLIFANDHWNFNVRGFNPGGNHGSFLRQSTHSVFMLAGGDETGLPRNMVVDEPYDSLSFVPTILELLGQHAEVENLPGRPVHELIGR